MALFGSSLSRTGIGTPGTTPPLAPAPTGAGTLMAPPTPPNAQLLASTAAGQAQLAAQKQRRKAAAGSLPNTPAPTSLAAPVLQPKTLLGY
jgi:hypothetical protein